MNRADRLFALLLQLQATGLERAQDLATTFAVSPKTIYRDMQALHTAGVQIVSLPGRGYAMAPGAFLSPLIFTGIEAGALAMGADHVAHTQSEPFAAAARTARAKLANILTAETRPHFQQVLDRAGRLKQADEPSHPMLRELRDAILSRRTLRIAYHAYGQSTSQDFVVEPYGLILYGQAWQLLAFWCDRGVPRLFRLDRVGHVSAHDVVALEVDVQAGLVDTPLVTRSRA